MMVNKYSPNYAIHPGEYLAEVLESRAISQSEFAQRTGLSAKTINHILSGKASYSTEVALVFERTLGISANIWIGLLEKYNLFEARKEEHRKFKDRSYIKWLKQFPLSDLTKLKLVRKTRNTAEKVEDLMKFLNIASPEAWKQVDNHHLAYYRKNTNFKETSQATAIWLHLARRIAERKPAIPNFTKEKLEGILPEIRRLTLLKQSEAMVQLESICAQVGLRFVLLPEFKDTHLSGAAFWIQSTPIITPSLRYKRNDHFWFSFFHEVGHILRHGKKGIYLDSFLSEGKIDSLKEEEQEANQFAANHLISESKWEEVKLINPISEQSIKGFAKKIEIHPGIIVGRLQREGLIPYNKLNDLKEKWDLVDSKIEI